MLKKYEAEMPRELGEGYVAASRAAIEKAVREKGDEMERKRKVELIREGVRRRYFRENSGPEDILDCGIHSGRKIRRCLSGPQVICQVGIGVGTTAHVDFEVFPIFSEKIDGSRMVVEGRKRPRTKNERGEIGSGWKFGRRDGFGGKEYGRGFQEGEMG